MRNVMVFEGGYKAVITYDSEIEMFRGEFVGLNGGADFYAKDPEGLKREGKSLWTCSCVCAKRAAFRPKFRKASSPCALTRQSTMMPALPLPLAGLV